MFSTELRFNVPNTQPHTPPDPLACEQGYLSVMNGSKLSPDFVAS